MHDEVLKQTHEDRFKDLEEEVKETVSWKTFAWVIAVGTFIVGATFTMVMNVSTKVNSTDVEMAKIQTKLTSIEAQILEVKILLKEHDK